MVQIRSSGLPVESTFLQSSLWAGYHKEVDKFIIQICVFRFVP